MPGKVIDLHTHSTASDGSMTPTQLVEHALHNSVAAIALSDHDTVSGVREALAAGKRFGVEVVPAIEFSVRSATETHLLGYYIDIDNPRLKGIMGEIIEKRIERNIMTSKLLGDLGFEVSLEDAKALAPGGFVGRAHFARVMLNKGYVESVKEAFDKYLASGRPAYFGNQEMEAKTAIEVIHAVGGVAFLAHPHLIKISDDELEKFLVELKGYGLDGIEGYYTDYDDSMQAKFQAMAKKYGLAISGGTDFHGAMKPHISIGKGLGNMSVPYNVLEEIKKLADIN